MVLSFYLLLQFLITNILAQQNKNWQSCVNSYLKKIGLRNLKY